MGTFRYKRVQEFLYPSSIVTQNNKENTEIKAKLQVGNKCYYGLSKPLKARMMSKG